MPIEIKELVVKMTVEESLNEQERTETVINEEVLNQLKEDIMEACMEKVKEYLADQKSR